MSGTKHAPPGESRAAVAEVPRSHSMLIGGEWLEAADGARIPSVDPWTGATWATIPAAGPEDVDRAVRAARAAFDYGPWGRTTGRVRSRLLHGLADLLERDAELLAEVETRDNGKLLREMRAQCRALPEWYRYFAGAADKLEGRVIASDKANFLIYTRREPVGVVAAVVPWNSPLLLLAWKVAPALAAGCTVVAKPSEQASASTLEFARRVEEAGLPAGVFNVVTGYGPTCGAPLVGHPGVNRVAFTGSTATGIEIARAAALNLARVGLELGGKSPNVVFEDAEVAAAANGVVAGIFAATGQTCIAGSRLLVHEDVHDELVERLVERARTIRLGDPTASETEMGPVAFPEQFDRIAAAVDGALAEGAELACGGGRDAELGGLFFQPTILTGVRPDMAVAREEIFGPVLSVLTFSDEDEAVRLANDSRYGLAAGVWTGNVHRAHRVAHRLRAGTVWVNAYRAVSFAAPFGGLGASGWGRENGLESLDGMLETKTVWVELAGETRDPFVIG